MEDNRELLLCHLLALRSTVDAALLALGHDDDVDVVNVDVACPQCNNKNGERIEDTSASGLGRRYTCLECGASWTLEVVAHG